MLGLISCARAKLSPAHAPHRTPPPARSARPAAAQALGNVPQHAAQRIAFLDKDMAALRVKREKMAVAIAREEAALARVLADEAGALAQLTALEEGNKARREQRQGLLGAIARAEKQVAAFVSGVASTKRDVVYNVVESDQRAASRALEEARGYSTGVVNKMHGDGVTVFATKASATALAKAGAASTLQSAV